MKSEPLPTLEEVEKGLKLSDTEETTTTTPKKKITLNELSDEELQKKISIDVDYIKKFEKAEQEFRDLVGPDENLKYEDNEKNKSIKRKYTIMKKRIKRYVTEYENCNRILAQRETQKRKEPSIEIGEPSSTPLFIPPVSTPSPTLEQVEQKIVPTQLDQPSTPPFIPPSPTFELPEREAGIIDLANEEGEPRIMRLQKEIAYINKVLSKYESDIHEYGILYAKDQSTTLSKKEKNKI